MNNLKISEYKAMDYKQRRQWMNANDLERLPVYQWGEYYYALYGEISLVHGVQRLCVFDVTEDLRKPLAERANFYLTHDGSLIEDYQDNPVDPAVLDEDGEQLSFYGRRVDRAFAVLLHSFDDFWTILGQQDGEITTRRSHYREAELPIQVMPPTAEQIRQVKQTKMDELEASVDAGGSIGL